MAELRLLVRGRDPGRPLFLNRYGDPMTRFGIHALVARHAEVAAEKIPSLKAKRISPHTIRHTTARFGPHRGPAFATRQGEPAVAEPGPDTVEIHGTI